MKATELIAMLAECVRNHGDCEVTVEDGGDPSDLCHGEGVSVDVAEGDKKFFQIYGSRVFERFPSKRVVAVYRDGDNITEQIAKALSEKSPFLTIIEGGKFENKRSDS